MTNYNVKETKEVLDFVIEIANTTKNILNDGKFEWWELVQYSSALFKMPKAVENINLVPAELNDLSEDEKNELIEYVKEKLQFEDKVEQIIENALKAIHYIYQVIKLL